MSALHPSLSWLEFTQLMKLSELLVDLIAAWELKPSNFLSKFARSLLALSKTLSACSVVEFTVLFTFVADGAEVLVEMLATVMFYCFTTDSFVAGYDFASSFLT
jgi:hypothetical protein